MASHRSIHSPTVSFPAFGSVHRPSRIRASWSRPQVSAAALSQPGFAGLDAAGQLYFTLHGAVPFPRFSAYAMCSPGRVLDGQAAPGWDLGSREMTGWRPPAS